ncbi:MAG: GAF domain-containing protein, partial [Bacillota bacterium]|nr:GAF domain-containing protein [Bacillota bacterium]
MEFSMKTAARIAMLYEIANSIGNELELQAMLDIFLEKVISKTGCTVGAIRLLDEVLRDNGEPNMFVLVSVIHYDRRKILNKMIKGNHFLMTKCLDNQQPIVFNKIGSELVDEVLINPTGKEKSILMLPIGTLGIFRICSGKEGFFDEAIVNILATLMPRLEKAINSCLLYEERGRLLQELEQQKNNAIAASNFKTQILANTTHELKTPLNVIINFTRQLQEELPQINSVKEKN